MQRGLRAFDKASAAAMFERTWLEFEPAAAGVDVVLRVTEAPANRAEVGVGYTEWEKARGAVRLRNQNTFGFGEEVELLLAGSDAEQRVELALRGERLFLAGPRVPRDRALERGQAALLRRRRATRSTARATGATGFDTALHSSLERWGLVEAGARFGRVRTDARAGLPDPAASEQVGALFARLTLDTLDDLAWPEHGQQAGALGRTKPRRARRRPRLLEAGGRRGRRPHAGPAPRRAGERLRRVLGETTCPSTTGIASAGPGLVPGYHHEELKGRQALAGARRAALPPDRTSAGDRPRGSRQRVRATRET